MPASPQPAQKPAKQNGVIDLLAVATGTAAGALGAVQLFAPFMGGPLTGLDNSVGSQLVALQWLVLAGLLLVGGITHIRVVSIFAAEFLMIGALSALAINLWYDHQSLAVFVHGAIAAMAFSCSGFARLTDKADLKRELKIMRQQALDASLADVQRPRSSEHER